MSTDLFISYAWTSQIHREWVRLLASQLHAIGYNVKIDNKVDYGSSLHGFMREVIEATHVLLIVDENYVDRANNKPESGVGIETKWINSVFKNKPDTWLSVVFVRNHERKLPNWLKDHNPKGFDFNSNPENNDFPGAFQIEDIWRWVEGLPADRTNKVSLSLLRKRTARLERVKAIHDQGLYANPHLEGSVTFEHKNHEYYTVGYGTNEFRIKFSQRSDNDIYVYKDGGLEGLGLIVDPNFDGSKSKVESFITLGRVVTPAVGQGAVLLNSSGVLCVIKIDKVQKEINVKEFVDAYVTFTYKILEED